MFGVRKEQLSVPLLAMTGLILAAAPVHAQIAQVLNTSPLFAATPNFFLCEVVNVSANPVTVTIELLNNAGAPFPGTAGNTNPTIPANNSVFIFAAALTGGIGAPARCRFTLANNAGSALIRANLGIFNPVTNGIVSSAEAD